MEDRDPPYWAWLRHLVTDEECTEAFELFRWGKRLGSEPGDYKREKLTCPDCGKGECITAITSEEMPRRYRCTSCDIKFNVLSDTPFKGWKRSLRNLFIISWYHDTLVELLNALNLDSRKASLLKRQIEGAGLNSKRDARSVLQRFKMMNDDPRLGKRFFHEVRKKYIHYLKRDEELQERHLREWRETGRIPYRYIIIRSEEKPE